MRVRVYNKTRRGGLRHFGYSRAITVLSRFGMNMRPFPPTGVRWLGYDAERFDCTDASLASTVCALPVSPRPKSAKRFGCQ